MRIFDRFGGSVMAQLIVRDLPAELVLALKRRPLAAVGGCAGGDSKRG
jgi:hypothetical protein